MFDKRIFRLIGNKLFLPKCCLLNAVITLLTIGQAAITGNLLIRLFSGLPSPEKAGSASGFFVFFAYFVSNRTFPALLAALLATVLLRFGANLVLRKFAAGEAGRIRLRLKESVTDAVYKNPHQSVASNGAASILTVFDDSVAQLSPYFTDYLPHLTYLAVLCPLVLCFVCVLDRLSFAVMLLALPLVPVFMILIGNMAREKTARQYEKLRFLSNYFYESLKGLTVLKVFSRYGEQVQKLAKASESFKNVTLSVLKTAFLSAFALELVTTLSVALVAVELGVRLLYGRVDYLRALLILLIMPEFYLPLRQLGMKFHLNMNASAAYDAYEGLVSRNPGMAAEGGAAAAARIDAIRVQHLGFCYEPDVPVLQDISFELRRGQRLAVTGESGSGKTTLMNCILFFLRDFDGQIMVNGIPVQKLDLPSYYARIAYVPQEMALFSDTLRNNLTLKKQADDARLADILGKLALSELLELPGGLDARLGDGGYAVSVGQKQRIFIARALLKAPDLLILDEHTQALDRATREIVNSYIFHENVDMMILTITHQLDEGSLYDRVITLG